jgi:hypothetical protein
MAWQKDETESVQSRRQEAHEQFKLWGYPNKENFKQKEKDHHESPILRHMVSSCSNDKGNMLR